MTESKNYWDQAEQVAKLAAGAALAVYVIGFLVTSLYYSTLGIAPINALRPRVVSAGLLLTFLLIAAYTLGKVSFNFSQGQAQDKVVSVSLAIQQLIVVSGFLGLLLLQMTDHPIVGVPVVLGVIIVPAILWCATLLLVSKSSFASLKYWALASLFLSLGSFVFPLFIKSLQEGEYGLCAWIFMTSLLITSTDVSARSRAHSAGVNMICVLSEIFLILSLFTHYIYPHFEPEWGGGAAISVTVTYGKDAAYLAGKVSPALLLDESDNGFYFIDHNLKRTYFIPRAYIAMMVYQERPTITKQ